MSMSSDELYIHDKNLYLSDDEDDENIFNVTDCLVLKIEEHCSHNNIDMTLYILVGMLIAFIIYSLLRK